MLSDNIMDAQEYKDKYGSMTFADLSQAVKGSAFRKELQDVYSRYFGRRVETSCVNCWWDAHHLIIVTPLKRMKERLNRQYHLRAGVVLADVSENKGAIATEHNLTDEMAMFHLRKHPQSISLFAQFPPDWQEQVSKPANVEAKASEEVVSKPAENKSEQAPAEATEGAQESAKPAAKKAAKPKAAKAAGAKKTAKK